MILELVLAAGVAAIGYAVYKHYTLAQVVAAVKAEVAKIEAEVKLEVVSAEAKTYLTSAVARLKALL